MMGESASLSYFLQKAPHAGSIEKLNQLLTRCLQSLGCKYWAYVSYRLESPYLPDNTLFPDHYTNYPEDWVKHYIEQRYDKIDPLVDLKEVCCLPYLWADFLKIVDYTPQQQRIFWEASDYGLDKGMSIPIPGKNRNMALLAAVPEESLTNFALFFQSYKEQLTMIAFMYHALINDYKTQENREQGNILSRRERECLSWVAQGKTDGEIAIILGNLSTKTVTEYINNAKKKLGVYNRTVAVVKAMHLHLI